ncbi:MAG: CehA/McbA family metallohydrolase [Candidatus Aminicenantes bacterium]|nr:MAG: CehA/McbA family metallohydrolase [Candidatus Aminicenantes bacterium]
MKAINKILSITFFLIVPLFLYGAEFQVKVIKGADDLPEEFCSHWKAGDILISDGKYLTIIGGTERPIRTLNNYVRANAMGSIISFVPAGKNLLNNLNIGSPVFKINERRKYITFSSVEHLKESLQGDTLIFEAQAAYIGKRGEKASVETTYQFFPKKGRIDIASTLTNTGKKEIQDLNYYLYFDPLHRYYFSPFNRKKHPGLNFRVYQKNGFYLAWVNQNPIPEEDEALPGRLAPKDVYEIRHILLVDTQHQQLLKKIYEILDIKLEEATIHFKNFGGNLMEVIVRDAFSSSVFFRSFLENSFSLNISLPKGFYKVRANFFPAVREGLMAVQKGEENWCILEDIPCGRVKVKIKNKKEEFVPGKVTFIGLAQTKTPYFKPDNPIKNGKYWETFKNSCFPKEDGIEVKLPVGTYLITASRGPEYSLDKKIVEIFKDERQELVFLIDRVIEIPNLISVDPHMHTQNSDGRTRIPERIKSVVAEGVNVAISTDHNIITDYYPTLKKLGLNKYLAVIAGSEVTLSGLIHYNTFPLKYRPDEEYNGAIYPLAEEVPPLFKASRTKDPEAILQVNHPRSEDLGYFNNYKLDKESAAFAREHFDISFDVLEVMNGPYFYSSSNYESIEDWFHLLNRGYYFPLTGSSDTHSIDREEPGYSRTYAVYEGKKGDYLNWDALARSIKKGHSFSSNGPIVELKVNGKYSSGDSFTERSGRVDVWIKVKSAPWIAVDEVRIIVNGERKIIFPVKTAKEVIQKFMGEIGLKLNRDSYIIVEVLGKESLFPVLQSTHWSGLLEKAILPYALTNPVFVDVDGNGEYDPPLPRKIEMTSEDFESKSR